MKVLVSGGAGYIGSHVVYELIGQGHQVVVYDNLSAGHRAAVHPDAELVQADLLDMASLNSFFADQSRPNQPPFDGVLHFASHIQVGESMRDPFKYIRDNVGAMTNLLEACTSTGVNRFILSSTANLFDEPKTIPIAEDAELNPGSVYGETKYIGERLLMWMDRIYGLKSCCLRYFNASGAQMEGKIGEDHQPETHLIPLILQVALGQREHIEVFGSDYNTPDGTCIRDYVHVTDLADAHILALEALQDGQSRVYNLGSGSGYSVMEVIETARNITETEIPVKLTGRRAGDLPVLVADSAKIKAELGWNPRYTDLATIVRTAWNWHSSHPNGYEDK